MRDPDSLIGPKHHTWHMLPPLSPIPCISSPPFPFVFSLHIRVSLMYYSIYVQYPIVSNVPITISSNSQTLSPYPPSKAPYLNNQDRYEQTEVRGLERDQKRRLSHPQLSLLSKGGRCQKCQHCPHCLACISPTGRGISDVFRRLE